MSNKIELGKFILFENEPCNACHGQDGVKELKICGNIIVLCKDCRKKLIEELMMNRDLKEKQLEIIEHYGMEKQLDQLIEECSELIKAICKHKRYENDRFNNYFDEVIEEMADVENLIEQFRGISLEIDIEIKETKEVKINREIKRIEGTCKDIKLDRKMICDYTKYE